jgi:hypothetical protein
MERPVEEPRLANLPETIGVLEDSVVTLAGVAMALTVLAETDAPLHIAEDGINRLATAAEATHDAVGVIATAVAIITERHQAAQGEALIAVAARFATTSGYFTPAQLRRHLEEEGLVSQGVDFRTLFRQLQPKIAEHMVDQGERVRWLRDGPKHALAFIAAPSPVVEVSLPSLPPAPPSAEQQRAQLSHNMATLFGDASAVSRKELLARMAGRWGTSSGDADSQLRALAAAGILKRENRKGTLYYTIGEEEAALPRTAAPKPPAAAEKPVIDPPFDEQEQAVATLLFDHFSSLKSDQIQRGTQQLALQRSLRRQHPDLRVTVEQYGAIIDRLVRRGYFTREVAQSRRTQGKKLQLADTYKQEWLGNRNTILSQLEQPHSAQDISSV